MLLNFSGNPLKFHTHHETVDHFIGEEWTFVKCEVKLKCFSKKFGLQVASRRRYKAHYKKEKEILCIPLKIP